MMVSRKEGFCHFEEGSGGRFLAQVDITNEPFSDFLPIRQQKGFIKEINGNE